MESTRVVTFWKTFCWENRLLFSSPILSLQHKPSYALNWQHAFAHNAFQIIVFENVHKFPANEAECLTIRLDKKASSVHFSLNDLPSSVIFLLRRRKSHVGIKNIIGKGLYLLLFWTLIDRKTESKFGDLPQPSRLLLQVRQTADCKPWWATCPALPRCGVPSVTRWDAYLTPK